MEEKRICPICGSEVTGDAKRIYCCRTCKVQADKIRAKTTAKPRICKVCGKNFMSIKQTCYCSPECKHKGQRRRSNANDTEFVAVKPVPKRKLKTALAKMEQLARDHGMHYGEFVGRLEMGERKANESVNSL